MQFRITLTPHAALDVRGAALPASAHTLGLDQLMAARVSELYFVRGSLTQADIARLCDNILDDPAAHTVQIDVSAEPDGAPEHDSAHCVEVAYLPGVMDPLALQLIRAAEQIGLPPIEVATGLSYDLHGDLSAAQITMLAERLLCNATVQRYTLGRIDPLFSTGTALAPHVAAIPLAGLNDAALVTLSKTRLLSLSIDEMRAIQEHFEMLRRAPTDVELETLAQTWSEHCVHKTFKALIEYTHPDGQIEQIDGLLKSTIRAATEQINAPWVRSAFVDNAGIIAFDDQWDLSFKVETHNHPSALEPFGGANTGVGGVIRDVMGVSARPIAVTDVLCFGPQDLPFDQLPAGTLHPRRVREGVVAGVADYGNKLGIPTVAGAVCYDPGYTANPLVFAGCVGIAPRGSHPTGALPGDSVIVLGGRTGRDGLHGATFSSDSLAHNTGQVVGTAVQIGNPIVQKDVMEVILRARDARLYTAITDCGAGGLSSAVGEMAEQPGGVSVELADVPLKYPGLLPWEIWLSEAQERMVVAVHPANWEALQTLCADWGVEATRIGTFNATGRLEVCYQGETVADLALAFMKDGLPRLHLKAALTHNSSSHENVRENSALKPLAWGERGWGEGGIGFLRLLSDPNTASKADIIHRYDYEVRGGTVIKPLIGAHDAPNDAAVIKPLETPEHFMGFALGVGISVKRDDPYEMAYAAVSEAIANIVSVGADPDRIALLDNFCWGDPKDAARLGALVAAAKACHDAALAYRTPFISGKDSLNNTYIGVNGVRVNIPDTLMISAISIVRDVTRAITLDLKRPGSRLFVYAPTSKADCLAALRALHQAIQNGEVIACHNVTLGGDDPVTQFMLALAKMCIAGPPGAQIRLEALASVHFESVLSPFIVELAAETPLLPNSHAHLIEIGVVSETPGLQLTDQGTPVADYSLPDLIAAYKRESDYTEGDPDGR